MVEKRNSKRLRLKPDEADIIEKYRRIKDEAKAQGLDPKTVHS